MRNLYVFALLAGSALAQNPAPPAFEVASVKLSSPTDEPRMAIETPGNTLTMRFVTLRVAMAWAYHTQRPQIVGPSWIDTEHFEILGKAARPIDKDEMRPMLQTLLAERFKLQFHRETRQVQVMAMTVPKEGHKMTPSKGGPVGMKQDPVRGQIIENAPLAELAEDLSHDVRMPVLDLTGLTGTFDFPFNIQKYVAAMRSRIMADPANRPTEEEARLSLMQDAMAGELGLKVDTRKAPVELLIIDHAEQKPVEN
jgi:uncharacterized protein (TIGR03435 family)